MQQKANTQLEASLDHNLYHESQLIELKVPLNLPYQTDWASYQRCDGEIQIKGIMYKYVKRKVANDTLYVMCIADAKKMHLETAKNDYFKIINDLSQNNKSKKADNTKSYKNALTEYDEYSFHVYTKFSLSIAGISWVDNASAKLFSSSHVSPGQPPDALFA